MDNKNNILDCALELFASRGYEAVGVQEIVDKAGITKPTLYHYFGSKQGLLNALLEEHFVVLNEVVGKACVYHHNLPNTLRRLARDMFAYAQEHPVFYRLTLGLTFNPPHSESYQAAAAFHQAQYEMVEAMFAKAVTDHGNMRGRQSLYAACFIGQINTVILLWLNGHIMIDDALIERSVHNFEHGIYS
jgi:TetR/AcrR family transcriptional regulator